MYKTDNKRQIEHKINDEASPEPWQRANSNKEYIRISRNFIKISGTTYYSIEDFRSEIYVTLACEEVQAAMNGFRQLTFPPKTSPV